MTSTRKQRGAHSSGWIEHRPSKPLISETVSLGYPSEPANADNAQLTAAQRATVTATIGFVSTAYADAVEARTGVRPVDAATYAKARVCAATGCTGRFIPKSPAAAAIQIFCSARCRETTRLASIREARREARYAAPKLACAEPGCGREFTPAGVRSRYCGDACKFRDKRRRNVATVHLPAAILAELEGEAARLGRPLSWCVQECVRIALGLEATR